MLLLNSLYTITFRFGTSFHPQKPTAARAGSPWAPVRADAVKSHLQLDLRLTHTAPLLNELNRLGYLAPKGAEFMPLIFSVYTSQVLRDRVDVGVVVVLRKTLNPWHN